jgi:transcription elongation GreA/GreB family factor
MSKEDDQAKRLAKLQRTLDSVQMPQADQNLVDYHRGHVSLSEGEGTAQPRERRPLAEEELAQASASGLIETGSILATSTGSNRLMMGDHTPQLAEDSEEVEGKTEMHQPDRKERVSERPSVDSSLSETLYDKLADQVEAFRRPIGSKRVAVGVSDDVFSRVSHLAFSRSLDKIDILTFLLHRHLGDLSLDRIPKWLSADTKGLNRIVFLSFVQSPDLAKTIAALQARRGMNKVDIVERVVLQWLPRAPFTVPAKQKRKSTRLG